MLLWESQNELWLAEGKRVPASGVIYRPKKTTASKSKKKSIPGTIYLNRGGCYWVVARKMKARPLIDPKSKPKVPGSFFLNNGRYYWWIPVGWYSWVPSVVWNEGLGLYIMVNGGIYGGSKMTSSDKDYYSSWMHTQTGSLGFWYSKKPYGPWYRFYYTDYWTVDDPKNRTYQPSLSPKWISKDGKEMVLIWSDAMENEEGRSHTVNYKWNHMRIAIQTQ